jgi:hypothetical protein
LEFNDALNLLHEKGNVGEKMTVEIEKLLNDKINLNSQKMNSIAPNKPI